jgi:hypothetical protein
MNDNEYIGGEKQVSATAPAIQIEEVQGKVESENEWWLEPMPLGLRRWAIDALDSGDVGGFLGYASNENGLALVFRNTERLIGRGLYELALLWAFTSSRVNNYGWFTTLADMFRRADRTRLRQAADALPGNGPFTLYRGVAGSGRARRVRGFSWTEDLEVAKWFALRFEQFPNPAVYQIIVGAKDVLAYCGDRNEREFIVNPATIRPKRIWEADYRTAEVRELRDHWIRNRGAELSSPQNTQKENA